MKCEKDVKKEIKKILHARGIYEFSAMMNGFGRAGVPDIIACHKGRFIAIEAKFGKNKTTMAQDEELRLIKVSGGISMVINENNLQDLINVLDQLQG